jgi:hypothetical protein
MAADKMKFNLNTVPPLPRHRAVAIYSNSLRVARLTNYPSILPSTTANVLRRSCATACRSPMRIDQSRQRPPGPHHWRRHRHSLGSFGPRNKRGRRQSVLLRARNRSLRAACKSPHSNSRHRATRRPDAQHLSGRKLVAARRQASGRATDAKSFSSVRSFFCRRANFTRNS